MQTQRSLKALEAIQQRAVAAGPVCRRCRQQPLAPGHSGLVCYLCLAARSVRRWVPPA